VRPDNQRDFRAGVTIYHWKREKDVSGWNVCEQNQNIHKRPSRGFQLSPVH